MKTHMNAPEFKVTIVEPAKAGIIGGPFMVIATKDGKYIASTSGCQTREHAEKRANEYRQWYGALS